VCIGQAKGESDARRRRKGREELRACVWRVVVVVGVVISV